MDMFCKSLPKPSSIFSAGRISAGSRREARYPTFCFVFSTLYGLTASLRVPSRNRAYPVTLTEVSDSRRNCSHRRIFSKGLVDVVDDHYIPFVSTLTSARTSKSKLLGSSAMRPSTLAVDTFIATAGHWFCTDPPTHLECSFCHLVLKQPVCCDSGLHTFCRKCVAEWQKHKPAPVLCPLDRGGLVNGGAGPRRAPLIVQDCIDRLQIKCSLGKILLQIAVSAICTC